jgi:hypothetical protein
MKDSPVAQLVYMFFFIREFVNYNQNVRNSINVTKTLATKHQKNLASRYKFMKIFSYNIRYRTVMLNTVLF